MSATDRRGVLGLALFAALAPAFASRVQATQFAAPLVAPPTGPMVYSRSVRREMAGNAAITVRRSYAVSFTPFSGGFMMQGRQTEVTVEGPSQVEQLLALERQRVDDAMFPLALDPFGHILSREGDIPGTPVIQRALAETLRELDAQSDATTQAEELRRFVVTLQMTGQRISAHLPIDLFAPQPQPRMEEHLLPIPDGGHGRVATMFEGVRDLATGLMRHARREVVTEMGGQQRGTYEQWTLTAA